MVLVSGVGQVFCKLTWIRAPAGEMFNHKQCSPCRRVYLLHTLERVPQKSLSRAGHGGHVATDALRARKRQHQIDQLQAWQLRGRQVICQGCQCPFQCSKRILCPSLCNSIRQGCFKGPNVKEKERDCQFRHTAAMAIPKHALQGPMNWSCYFVGRGGCQRRGHQ